MQKFHKKPPTHDDREGIERRTQQPTPGKVTRTSKLPAAQGPTVQRQTHAGSSVELAPEVTSLWDHTMDPWMDAALRGTPLPSEARMSPVQAKGAAEASGSDEVYEPATLSGRDQQDAVPPAIDSLVEAAGEEKAPTPPMPAQSVLASSNPDVDGRTVSSVGADLRERARRYLDSISVMRESAESSKRLEEKWYDELGLIGGIIDLFNSVDQTDPRRWDVVLLCWESAAGEFEKMLALQVRDDSINQLGLQGERAIEVFEDASMAVEQCQAEFMRYLRGFEGSAQNAVLATTIVQDVSFAAAVGIAVVMAAPVVFGAAGSFATGTLGLSGASATVFAGGTTAVAMGGIGAGIEGGGQMTASLVVEGSQLIADLMDETKTWEQAIDGFEWGVVAEEGWDGFKRGFVDGVLAYAGMGFERVLHSGAQVALNRLLGETGGQMLAQVLRRAMERAVASGAAGGVIGALDAGIKTAMNGGSIGAVLQAVQDGFVIGAVVGTTMGTGGGAIEGRRVARTAAEVDELQRLLREEPEAFAARFNELVATMNDEQRVAFQRELQGRRFVDAEHYGPAAEAYESGASSAPPEHRYGQQQFEDWSGAAHLMDEHARSGQPLTQGELMAAHARAARNITDEAGRLRTVGTEQTPLIGGGGVGFQGMFSTLTPEQVAVLESNPHIRLIMRGKPERMFTPELVGSDLEVAVIAYPNFDEVAAKLDEFFSWYARHAQHRRPYRICCRGPAAPGVHSSLC